MSMIIVAYQGALERTRKFKTLKKKNSNRMPDVINFQTKYQIGIFRLDYNR